MNINSINGVFGSSVDLLKNDSRAERFTTKTDNTNQPLGYKDRIDISKLTRNNISRGNVVPARGIGLTIDKGTAANTTLFVDRGTFNQIASYTTNNPECQWDEIGVDGEKRWIVVNGQRFECPLSEEEKELRRRLAENSNLISIITKADKEKKVHKNESEKHDKFKMTFDGNDGLKIEGLEGLQGNEKIQNLMKNDKVMNMLSHIMKNNGGMGISFGL